MHLIKIKLSKEFDIYSSKYIGINFKFLALVNIDKGLSSKDK